MLDQGAVHKILIGAIVALICLQQLADIRPAGARTIETHKHTRPNNHRETDDRKLRDERRQLLSNDESERQIPGLYEDMAEFVHSIRGQREFDRLILGRNDSEEVGASEKCSRGKLEEIGRTDRISLVQFYMATCPDCQGFSPYFKRFARDIAPHWRALVRLYTVNCNDFQNIHLCQEQNPRLIVPLVRWYTFPAIQFDSELRNHYSESKHGPLAANNGTASSSIDDSDSGNKFCNITFAPDLLSVSHRQFNDEQRRDLISLRRATLRYSVLMIRELASGDNVANNSNPVSSKRVIFNAMRGYWRDLLELRRGDKLDYLNELQARLEQCWQENGRGNSSRAIENFVVLEPSSSFIGRTLVADWSDFACGLQSAGGKKPLVLIHRSSDSSLLKLANVTGLPVGHVQEPILLHFSAAREQRLNELKFEFLASNLTNESDFDEEESDGGAPGARIKRQARAMPHRLERVGQRASLERYYHNQPDKYAASMVNPWTLSPFLYGNGHSLHKRQTNTYRANNKTQTRFENANWTPSWVYPGEERLRFQFNRIIADTLNLTEGNRKEREAASKWPGSLLNGTHPGKIDRVPPKAGVEIIDPVTDDRAFMLLTDYYKGLDEIVHVDLLSKGSLDGYQMLASCCFVSDLVRHFPFQGNAIGSQQIGSKSVASHYINLIQQTWLNDLKRELLHASNNSAPDDRWHASMIENLWATSEGCPNLNKLAEERHQHRRHQHEASIGTSVLFRRRRQLSSASGNKTAERTIEIVSKRLEQLQVASRKLEDEQLDIRRRHDIGLPASKHLRWAYCAGSGAYLRGHTCSLWIIFHTMTVNEYVDKLNGSNKRHRRRLSAATRNRDNDSDDGDKLGKTGSSIEYEFQIDYKQKPRRACNPKSPEEALIQAKTSDLYVNSTNYALANIINFVRFYLPCTNCAAHFSCMVEHTPDLHFGGDNLDDAENEQAADWHLLWLWEGHNLVNERTRGTHSEDPSRPKHVFPQYKACEQCYLERPAANASFTSMRFNRPELVKFIVARYRKSAILNNKINIEDLYRKV